MSYSISTAMNSATPFTPLDTFTAPEQSTFGTRWEIQTDQNMGGQSQGSLHRQSEASPPHLTLTGSVSLENTQRTEDGGFIQATLPLVRSRQLYNAQAYLGVRIVCNSVQQLPIHPQHHGVRLYTRELSMPWQHYLHHFQPTAEIQAFELPFSHFTAVNTSHELSPAYLMSLAIVTGQENFSPHLNIYEVGFYGNVHPL